MDELRKALNTLELGHLEGSVSRETIEKARSQAGVYSNTYQNKKLGRVGKKYTEGDKKQENPQDKEGDSTHDFNLEEGQQVRVQGETKFQRVVEVRGNSARLSESGNNFVHVTKLTDSKGEPIVKERKADKGEIKELEDAVKSLKGQDKEDLGFVLSSYKEGDLKSATAEANNLDTAMREMIPVGILKELGFKLTPKEKRP